MGNPEFSNPLSSNDKPRGPLIPGANGILTYIQADTISRALATLPRASAEEREPQRQVVMDVPSIGQVRITFELHSYRHYRSSFWHWKAIRADQVEPPPPAHKRTP